MPLGNLLMPRVLTIVGMAIAVVILVLFALDLATSIPFKRQNLMMDIAFVICSAGLAYLSWSAMRDLN